MNTIKIIDRELEISLKFYKEKSVRLENSDRDYYTLDRTGLYGVLVGMRSEMR